MHLKNQQKANKYQPKRKFVKFPAACVRHFIKTNTARNFFLIENSELARRAMKGGVQR